MRVGTGILFLRLTLQTSRLAPRPLGFSRRILAGRACQLQLLIAGPESVTLVWAPRRQDHERLHPGLTGRKLEFTRWVSVERFRQHRACQLFC